MSQTYLPHETLICPERDWKPKRLLSLCLFCLFAFLKKKQKQKTMACYRQTCLLDVSELSGPTRGSFPAGIVCVYRFKEFHFVSLSSRVALRVSSLPWQGKGPAVSPDCLGGIGGTVVNTAAFQITQVLGLVSVTREPLLQSGCSLHCASDIPHFVHLWILHKACHFYFLLSKPSLFLSVHSMFLSPSSPHFSLDSCIIYNVNTSLLNASLSFCACTCLHDLNWTLGGMYFTLLFTPSRSW